jgi:hypothetical protein
MKRKRWPIVLAALAATLLLALWLGSRLLQPQRVTGFLIAAIERASGLQVSVSQPADYAFRPAPRLRLSGVRVSTADAAPPLFEIGLLDLSLPWNTLLGGAPVIRALRIERASVDVAGLSEWLSQRPPSAGGEWPVLEDGLQIRDSRLIGAGWSAQVQTLDVPHFALEQPLALSLSASIRRDPSDAAGTPADWPFALRIDALPRQLGSGIALDLRALQMDAPSPLPSLQASGAVAFGDSVALNLDGTLADWPADWPPLPLPASTNSLAFQLKATGSGVADLDLTASLQRDGTRIELQLLPAQLRAWLDAEPGTPLPPLRGELESDQLEIDGTRLEGVHIRVEPDPQP